MEGLSPFPCCQGSNCCNLSVGFGLSTSSSFRFAPSGSRVDTDLSTGVRMPSMCAAVMVIGGCCIGDGGNMGGPYLHILPLLLKTSLTRQGNSSVVVVGGLCGGSVFGAVQQNASLLPWFEFALECETLRIALWWWCWNRFVVVASLCCFRGLVDENNNVFT